jgi:transposase
MLRHGRQFPRKITWTKSYLRWLQEQKFDHPAHQIVLQEAIEAMRLATERLGTLGAKHRLPTWSLAPLVHALEALRGVSMIVAVTFANRGWRLRRFESPRQLMGYLGLVPSERSTGETVRRGPRSPRHAIAGCGTCSLKVQLWAGNADARD